MAELWICNSYTGFQLCHNMVEYAFEKVLNNCRVLNLSGVWIFYDCQYARVLNFQDYTGFTYFRKYDKVLNMRWNAIIERFWIFQASTYARFLHMQAPHKVLNMPEYTWINCSNNARLLNIPGQSFKGFWIGL